MTDMQKLLEAYRAAEEEGRKHAHKAGQPGIEGVIATIKMNQIIYAKKALIEKIGEEFLANGL
jgi:hypothetical protein